MDNLHGVFVDACLEQGITKLANGDAEAALNFFESIEEEGNLKGK